MSGIGHFLRRLSGLKRDSGGNILMMAGFALVPLIFAVGFGIDYSRAMRLQTLLNAAADAAALSAVSSSMMQQGTSAAQTAATNMFNAEASTLVGSGLVYNANTDLTVNVVTSGTLNNGRTVTVTYNAKSTNIFGGILGASTLPVAGTATATATKAPYINFYLLLDTSPSMLLPTTSTGLSNIRSANSTVENSPTGCDFACHQQLPNGGYPYVYNGKKTIFLSSGYYNSGQSGYQTYYTVDTNTNYVYDSSGNQLANYYYNGSDGGVYYNTTTTTTSHGKTNTTTTATQVSGYWADGYWLTHNYGILFPGNSSIDLRIDDERAAAQALIPTAQTAATNNRVSYQMQMFAFNWTHSGSSSPVTALTSSMTDVNNLSSSNVPDLYAAQDFWYKNNCPSSSYCNSDMGTEVTNALSNISTTMGTPGDGSSSSSPQEVLLIVTDGMSDETYNGSRWNRELNTGDLALCSAIKKKGITIAILYTQYLSDSLTGDSWSQSNVAPYLSNVSTALQNCASTSSGGSPLFFTVSTDQSISTALSTLFALTIQNARLTK